MDTILVPTDGSPSAEAAVDHAIMLAERNDATVHGLFVVYVTNFADFEGGVDVGAVQGVIEEEGERAVEAIEKRCKNAGVAVETALRTGRPVAEIHSYADEIAADLIVMGTHGRSGISRLLLGSVTEAVLRRGDIPVLAIPAGVESPSDGYKGVLVATDASDGSRVAVETAVEWAGTLETTLDGLYVVDAGLAHSELIERALEGEGAAGVATVKRLAEEAGVEVRTAVETGVPHETITEYAAENDLDLIVVGSHGRDAVERVFLGSVSERTVRTADRPVLVVRAPKPE